MGKLDFESITIRENEIFVFPSNVQGIHGAGLALLAKDSHGAQIGVGEGPTGRCYAIPTRTRIDDKFVTLPIPDIFRSLQRFDKYAKAHPETTFKFSKIGCGLAGYDVELMASLCYFIFFNTNVRPPKDFFDIYLTYGQKT